MSLGGAAPALAQMPDDLADAGRGDAMPSAIERPSGSERLVRLWDFEDRATHREPIPEEWFRDQHVHGRLAFGIIDREGRERPGFPPWNRAEYSDAMSYSGAWSMSLPTRGGSTALTLSRSVLSVFDGSDYLVTGMVRTAGFRHARARIVVRMLDIDRMLIDRAEFTSEPMISEDGWQRLSVGVDATPGAVWMQIELQALQPSEWRGQDMDEKVRELLPQDFEGAAHFDDLAVYQLPRVELEVLGQWPVAGSTEPPTLTVALRDQAGEALRARLRVFGLDGVLVDERVLETPLDLTPIAWHPALPGYGWYRAEAAILNDVGIVGFAEASFGWTPPGREMSAQSRTPFGIVIDGVDSAVLATTPPMVRASGAGSASLQAWGDDSTVPDPDHLRAAIERLSADGVELTMVLAGVPTGIAAQAGVDRNAVLQLLADTPPEGWLGALRPLLATFGERIRRWQVGRAGDASAWERPDLEQAVASVHEVLRRLIPRPMVVLPGPGSVDATIPAGRTPIADQSEPSMLLEYGVPEASIGEQVRAWSSWAAPAVVIEPLPESVFGQRSRVLAMARRAVLALEGGAAKVSVVRPWQVEPRTRRDDLVLPMPEMVAMRRLVDELSGKTASVRLPLGEGVVGVLFEDERSATLVAWSMGGDPDKSVLDGYLGDGPIVARDLWGNESGQVSAGEPVELTLTEVPLFLRGVDPRIVRLRAGIDFQPRRLSTRGALIAGEVTLVNPFQGQITGRLRMTHPDAWDLRPQIIEFAIEEGGTTTIPVELRIGVAELSGDRELTLEVEAIADRRYPPVLAPIEVQVGLPNLHVLPMYRLVRSPAGRLDLIVEAMITNMGERPVSCSITVLAPGFASEKAPLSGLLPGQVAIRRFSFPDGGRTLPGRTAYISLRETDGNDRLNVELPIH